jgi:hypothetical protein
VQISFQGNSWDADDAKFSVGFGLVIFAVLEITVFFVILGNELKDLGEDNQGEGHSGRHMVSGSSMGAGSSTLSSTLLTLPCASPLPLLSLPPVSFFLSLSINSHPTLPCTPACILSTGARSRVCCGAYLT